MIFHTLKLFLTSISHSWIKWFYRYPKSINKSKDYLAINTIDALRELHDRTIGNQDSNENDETFIMKVPQKDSLKTKVIHTRNYSEEWVTDIDKFGFYSVFDHNLLEERMNRIQMKNMNAFNKKIKTKDIKTKLNSTMLPDLSKNSKITINIQGNLVSIVDPYF